MQVQPGPLRAEEEDLTRTALEKVLTRHFFHIHSHSFFPLLFFSSFLSSYCPISPSLTSKCYLCKNWWSFPVLALFSLEAHVLFWSAQYLQFRFVRIKKEIFMLKKKLKNMVLFSLSHVCPVCLLSVTFLFSSLSCFSLAFPLISFFKVNAPKVLFIHLCF